jgi:hypothetical protein
VAGVGLPTEILAAARNSIPSCIGHDQRQEGVEDGVGGVGNVRAEVICVKIAVYISCNHSCYDTKNQDSARSIVLEIDLSPCVPRCISIVVYL